MVWVMLKVSMGRKGGSLLQPDLFGAASAKNVKVSKVKLPSPWLL